MFSINKLKTIHRGAGVGWMGDLQSLPAHPAWPEDEWLDARAQAGTPEATALIQSADLLFLCCETPVLS